MHLSNGKEAKESQSPFTSNDPLSTGPSNPTTIPVRQSSTLTTSFPFERLPTELRLQVYSELLLETFSFITLVPNLSPTRCHKFKSLYPSILRVSRSIYAEAKPVLYSSNTFMISTFPTKLCTPSLVAHMGPENARLIRRVFTTLYERDRIRREQLQTLYAALNIDFEKLHVWAVRTKSEEDFEKQAVEQADWLEKVEEGDLVKLNMEPEWMDFGEGWKYQWLVKKGSMPRR